MILDSMNLNHLKTLVIILKLNESAKSISHLNVGMAILFAHIVEAGKYIVEKMDDIFVLHAQNPFP